MNSLSDPNKYNLIIHSRTWNRDSHGLYDYENNSVNVGNFPLDKSGMITRKKWTLKFIDEPSIPQHVLENEEQILIKITKVGNKFIISNEIQNNLAINNDNLTSLQDKIWNVIKSNNINNNVNIINNSNFQPNFQYSLRKNDIIKLGRIKFLIKEINVIGSTNIDTGEIFKSYQDCSFIENTESNICRICLHFTVEEENPMISICKCKGSMSLIHLKCLKNWLQHKLSVREFSKKPGLSYTIKAYNCEICKEPYPITINYCGNSFNLLNYSIPENSNFVILESLNSIKENQYPLSVHILVFVDNEHFILGRGHDSDVRISDISVSRVHSKIYFKDNQLVLEDCGSKFGTLVLVKNEVEIKESIEVLQIGRTLISTYKSNSIVGIPKKNEELPGETKKYNDNQKIIEENGEK